MRLSFFQEVLLATAAGLAVLVIVELYLLMPDSALTENKVATEPLLEPISPSDDGLSSFTLPPRKALRDFVQRPLFERTRRSVAGATATPEDSGEISDIMLIGTVITVTETFAILQVENAKPVRAAIGDVVGGWRVMQIRQDGVQLSNGQSEGWVSTGSQN